MTIFGIVVPALGALVRDRSEVVMEHLSLRQQFSILRRQLKWPRLRTRDRTEFSEPTHQTGYVSINGVGPARECPGVVAFRANFASQGATRILFVLQAGQHVGEVIARDPT